MEYRATQVDFLVDEYATLIKKAGFNANEMNARDWETMLRILPRLGDWTDSGAIHLVWLVRQYGVFMLRNALALAVAAGIEDGELGL